MGASVLAAIRTFIYFTDSCSHITTVQTKLAILSYIPRKIRTGGLIAWQQVSSRTNQMFLSLSVLTAIVDALYLQMRSLATVCRLSR